ncbi:MAG: ABC transporter ATP-binding protein [Nitrospirae bacterium]|nr:ABC transporter ATP-binding protein [Nitrospirota bacterium]
MRTKPQERPGDGKQPVLEIKGIGISFGGLVALADITFTVGEREIKAVIGPNGAGKTTLLNIISGIYTPDKGEVAFLGKNISRLSPAKIARRGISRTFQHVELFGTMTVLENIMLGRHLNTRAGFLSSGLKLPPAVKEDRDIKKKSEEVLEYIGLKSRGNERASNLPIGEERILEIGRALATEPKLLLLDEPASGLNETETIALTDFIKRLRDEKGLTIILVEHDMGLVMNLSEKIVVLDFGEKIAEGNPAEIKSNKLVIDAYLGAEDSI